MRARTGIGVAAVMAIGAVVAGWLGAAGCGGSSDVSVDTDSGTPDGGDDSGNPACGNKLVEGVEECDDGNDVNGDGCENDCTFTCKPADPLRGDAHCDDKNPCDGVEKCQADHTCSKGTTAADGTSCGTSKICKGGACIAAVCGDKIVTAPEECDDGNAVNGDGCDNCKFSCKTGDATRDCTPTDPCKGTGTCDDATHTCTSGAPLADGTACGTGMICKGGTCVLATCGNGVVDPGEDCEPPGTATCDATCHTIKAAACGDGTRDTTEQCDDGNTTNLDGCSATCAFEQDHRANSVQMIYDTSVCPANALGGAMGSAAQSQIKSALDKGVKDGSTTLAFEFLALDDLTGTADSSLSIGGITGSPAAAPAGVTYDGSNDLDWWYTTDTSVIDATRTPTAQLAGSIVAKHLNVGPGTLNLMLSLSGGPAPIKVTQTTLSADVGATSTPTASIGSPPGHLVSEHDDPALVSFATMSNGKMCGNVSARSLASVPAPSAIVSGGAINCAEGYTTSNSLLDVLVGGCKVLIFITAIKPTQPDQFDPAAASPGGAGGPYKFTESSSHAVTGCMDKSGKSVPLDACLDYLAYSSSFTFTTDRVIAK